MAKDQVFHTHTALADGLRELFKQLEERLALRRPLKVYLAGGMAIHLYTANRVTFDVDAEFGGRVHLPQDLMVQVTLEDGREQVIYLDTNYNSTFALMHEDYQDDAIPVEMGVEHLRVHVLAPVDLAVSKISRFAENDQEDIAALVLLGLTTADELEKRATHAVVGYVGGLPMLMLNLRDAVALAREVEQRLGALDQLENRAGAALTFWQHATAALKAPGIRGVDWGDVEERAFVESIAKNGQLPSDVADMICRHSPGAVTKKRQETVRSWVGARGPELQTQYRLSRGGPAQEINPNS